MEKQKERLEILSEMSKQILAVAEKLNQLREQTGYGELDPGRYTQYKTEFEKYIQLDAKLNKLTSDIDKSDKSEVQGQPKRGAFPPEDSPKS